MDLYRYKKALMSLAVAVAMVCASSREAFPQKNPQLFSRENLVAWCIVPYDNKNRTPTERAQMLRELGITQLAWDWRDKHLPTLTEEIHTLQQNDIKLKSVWFWVNGTAGQTLDESNHYILKTLKENNVQTELWLSFNDRFFEGLSDADKLKKAVAAVGEINQKARDIGCSVHLYNHGSWFGEPANQVKIIKALDVDDIGIVYNFHHARHQIHVFPDLLKLMQPYLTTVNINGMREGGPMILTVGEGNRELEMLKTLKKSGYAGTIGVLCHVEDEDAKVVLRRNIEGLKTLLRQMEEKKALKSYQNQ